MTYHWQDELGHWQVGRAAEAMMGGDRKNMLMGTDGSHVLIRHWPTGELEWVPESKLMPYPAEPIESP